MSAFWKHFIKKAFLFSFINVFGVAEVVERDLEEA
jgi:hypothetical protein